jgi:hypothetical protein
MNEMTLIVIRESLHFMDSSAYIIKVDESKHMVIDPYNCQISS